MTGDLVLERPDKTRLKSCVHAPRRMSPFPRSDFSLFRIFSSFYVG